MDVPCPICSEHASQIDITPGFDGHGYSCPHCGDYELGGRLLLALPRMFAETGATDANARLSYTVKNMQRGEGAGRPRLSNLLVERVLKAPLPSPKEQADNLIRWLGENSGGPGKSVNLSFMDHGSIVGCASEEGWTFLILHLFDAQLLVGSPRQHAMAGTRPTAHLSFKGWELYERLRTTGAHYRRAFMAMKFGDPVLDQMVETLFKPATQKTGFRLIRLDEHPKAGLIDDRLRVEIRASDFVIADLSHDNLGAYWEAGYAEGLGKPVIYSCEENRFKDHQTHFDTNHHLTVQWNVERPEVALNYLIATIRATLPHLAIQQTSDESEIAAMGIDG